MKTKINIKNEILKILILIITTVVVALGLWVFVYKSDFAPSGVDGLATVLQYLTKVNAGIFTFALNFPLLVAAWFILKKRYVIYTLIYTVVLSTCLLLFEKFGVYQYEDNDVLAAVFAGATQGLTGILLKIGGSSGGVDVMGSMIQKKFPHKNLETIIAYLSYVVVIIGFIVYGNLHSALLSVIEVFLCERVSGLILRDRRSAVKFEVIIDNGQTQAIKDAIICELRHGVTIVKAKGALTNDDKDLLICLVSYRQIAEFLKLIKKYEGVFVYYSDVMGIHGNFDWRKDEEKVEDMEKRMSIMGSFPKEQEEESK